MQPSEKSAKQYGFDVIQKISISLMGMLVLLTFVGANLHAVMWQSSAWLVSTVLPAVVVDLTNDERVDSDASPLQRNATLDKAAKLKAEHMAKNEYFSHYSPDGVSPWYWFDKAGYVYAHAGENLAIHFSDSSEVVEAWMNSPTHRANIVNQKYTEIGVGTAKGTFDGYDTVYVVQLFGAPGIVPAPTPTPTPTPALTSEPVIPVPEQIAEVVKEIPPVLAIESTPLAIDNSTEEVAGADIQLQSEITDSSTEVAIAPEVVLIDSEIPIFNPETTFVNDEVVVESTIATSSGLVVASVANTPHTQAGTTAVSMATQPNELLQWVYIVLGSLVTLMLFISGLFEARKLHYLQVAYSVGLLVVMGGLWFVNALLTSGAVIV